MMTRNIINSKTSKLNNLCPMKNTIKGILICNESILKENNVIFRF